MLQIIWVTGAVPGLAATLFCLRNAVRQWRMCRRSGINGFVRETCRSNMRCESLRLLTHLTLVCGIVLFIPRIPLVINIEQWPAIAVRNAMFLAASMLISINSICDLLHRRRMMRMVLEEQKH